MVRRFLKMIMMTAAVVALTVSCGDDDPVAEAAPAVRDAEVSVSVRFSLPQSRTGDRAACRSLPRQSPQSRPRHLSVPPMRCAV